MSKTLVIIPSTQQAVRLSGVTQREILTDLVPRCFTDLCILTAMNGCNVGNDEDIADWVPNSLLLKREVQLATAQVA
ncbi:hypothetical protein [Allocoleopsis sp.]|uniref:hypothetical protein n=1 Tax=Allocoleopsis sp. TaxID=3088169 RepID=UPI002FD50512